MCGAVASGTVRRGAAWLGKGKDIISIKIESIDQINNGFFLV